MDSNKRKVTIRYRLKDVVDNMFGRESENDQHRKTNYGEMAEMAKLREVSYYTNDTIQKLEESRILLMTGKDSGRTLSLLKAKNHDEAELALGNAIIENIMQLNPQYQTPHSSDKDNTEEYAMNLMAISSNITKESLRNLENEYKGVTGTYYQLVQEAGRMNDKSSMQL